MTCKTRKSLFYSLPILLLALVAFSIYQALLNRGNAASWIQVAIEALALPIVLYELFRIRISLEAKPDLVIGLASVKDLPLSNIADQGKLPKAVSVDRGYAFFMLVIRNRGQAIAKSVKIHFEYLPPEDRQLLTPIIKTYEWQEGKPHVFSQENNVDFVFLGGSDWYIHPSDSEAFGFFLTTVLVLEKDPQEIRERPEPGTYEFACSIRAEGVDQPIHEKLYVEITDQRGAI